MKSGGKAIAWLLAGFTLTLEGTAYANNSGSSSDGPYRAIVDRNIFDLRPVPPVTAPPGPVTPPPNVKFVGVMRITDRVQGVFSVQDPTPGKQPVSYILSQDQRQGTLEVKSINMAAKPPTASVRIGDELVMLKLDDPKAPTGPAPAPAAGPGQRTFGPGGGRGRSAFPMPTPGQPAGGAAPSASYSPGASPDAGNGALPTRPVRTDGTDQQLTPEQQMVQMEQNRENYRNSATPELANLLPPTPLTSAMNGGTQPTGDTSGNSPSTGGNILPSTPLTAPLGSRSTGTFRPPPPMPP